MNNKNTSIFFRTKQDKALATLLYILSYSPDISNKNLARILFLSERDHVLNYGRPIYGDVYFTRNREPIPSVIKDFLDMNFSFYDIEKDLKETILGNGNYNLKNINLTLFSSSDKKILDSYIIKSENELLVEIMHDGILLQAAPNVPIGYENFIDEDDPNYLGKVEQLCEQSFFTVF